MARHVDLSCVVDAKGGSEAAAPTSRDTWKGKLGTIDFVVDQTAADELRPASAGTSAPP
jgi:hypothetical protein